MFNRRHILGVLPAAMLLAGASSARATVYFNSGSVKKQLFPSATRFVDRSVSLTKVQKKAIRKAAKTRVHSSRVVAMDAYAGSKKLGTLFIDKVFGKHEFITYAVALNTAGAVSGIEIMDFRESHGDQVRGRGWRAQFNGKRSGQPLKIDKQIKNISGATLSCVHITNGVRRVLATNALMLG